MTPALRACAGILSHSLSARVVVLAVAAATATGQDPERVAKDLADRRAEVRIHACEIARDARMSDPRVVAALLRCKEDPGNAAQPVRDLAIKALVAGGPAAVPALLAALAEVPLRDRACSALGTIRPVDARTPAALATVVNDHSRDHQGAASAAVALGALGPDGAAAVPAIVALLDGKPAQQAALKGDARSLWFGNAMRALGQIGPRAEVAITSLLALADVVDGTNAAAVRRDAIGALGQIGFGTAVASGADGNQQRVLALLRRRLDDKDGAVADAVRATLAVLDAEYPADAAARMRGLSHQDARIRLQTCRLLGAMGKRAVAARETLQRLATDDADESVRQAAIVALKDIAQG